MTDDWHTSDYPELRPGPPWVMEEMIRAQAALPDGLAALDGAHAIRDAAARALAAGDEVVVVGCGTSEHAALAVAALLRDGLATSTRVARRIRSQQALDTALDPPPTGVVIGVSHDGGTQGHLAGPRPRTARRRRHRGDHRAAGLGHRRGGRPCLLDADARSLVVPHGGLHERHPGRRRDRLRRVGCVMARGCTDDAGNGARRQRCSDGRPSAASRPAHPVRRRGHRSDQRPRARPQDRGGCADSGDRPSPRDGPPRAPGRLRARIDACRLPRRRPEPRRPLPRPPRARGSGGGRGWPPGRRDRTPGRPHRCCPRASARSSSSRPTPPSPIS